MERRQHVLPRSGNAEIQTKNTAIGNLRTYVTLLVVFHHSLLAYVQYAHFDRRYYLWSTAPIVDKDRWLGFDLLVDFNDIYFMSLMFFISGVFVIPSLIRRGPWNYLSSRIVRLGIPFVIAVTVLMPIAYYPSYLQTGSALSFPQYWMGYFSSYGWPAGPAWFIWVLLLFDSLIVLMVLRWPAVVQQLIAIPNWLMSRPLTGLALFTAIALGAYLPTLYAFGPAHWISRGPFAVQASRLFLYITFFVAGAALGSAGAAHPILEKAGPFARSWAVPAIAGLVAFSALVSIQIAALRQASFSSNPIWFAVTAFLFVVACSSISIAFFGGFIRYFDRKRKWADLLASCAFGIYLVHYVVLTWVQTALLKINEPAAIKAGVAFVATVSVSWIAVAFLRKHGSLRLIF